MSAQVQTPVFVGTPKQCEWAGSIYRQFQERYPDSSLAENCYASWWISHRDCTLEEILASQEVRSPFSATFPKFDRADVAPLLRNMNNFIVLDTETSGLDKHSEVIELAVVSLTTDEVLFNSLLCPKNIEAYAASKARSMHSFSLEEVQAAPTLPSLWAEIRSILEQHHACSYNAAFDGPMLRRSAMAWGLPTPGISMTCIMKAFQAYECSDSPFSLAEACSAMNINQDSFGVQHTALADALAATALLKHMRDTL